jgi:plastocyanin
MQRPWVALAASIALAGCGGGDDEEGRAVTVPAGQDLRVSADEYSFDPSRITVEEPGELTITLRNKGELAHDLRVEKDGRDIGGTPVFESGQRAARIRLTRGDYSFICSVGDHEELGMKGTLRVR